MRLLNFYSTNVGKKVVVAVTGAIMISFLLAHVYGNMHVYFGADEINEYSDWLRTFAEHIFGYGGFLWIVRVIVGGALILHVVTIIQLIARNRAARPVGYRKTSRRKRIIVGSTMALSGLIILFFIVFHILQFTTGTIQPTPFHVDESNGLGIVYINLYQAFQVWWIAGLYVFVMLLIGFHVYHGAWSMFQSLGMNNQDRNPMFRLIAALLAIGLFLGFSSVPILFWTNVLPPPAGLESTETDTSHAKLPAEEITPWN
ncbi:MAG: succinate dehydrogenase cytochrome b subunit [Phycisphaerales bacterium]|nr:succinate dehydrogenase cytochrome b subunit [Phycisphaerales bacterium]